MVKDEYSHVKYLGKGFGPEQSNHMQIKYVRQQLKFEINSVSGQPYNGCQMYD